MKYSTIDSKMEFPSSFTGKLLLLLVFSLSQLNLSALSTGSLNHTNINKLEKVNSDSLPTQITLSAQPYYKHRSDDKPGREIMIDFNKSKIFGDITVITKCKEKIERNKFSFPKGTGHISVLLPEGVGVNESCKVAVTVTSSEVKLQGSMIVPAKRQWKIYLYNHAHVDLGYTTTQETVELIHKRNIFAGIKLANETKNYPKGAQYCWNPEVTWALERIWETAKPKQKENIVKAIKNSALCLDASYMHLNTSVCSDEELFHLFSFSRKMQKITGMPMDVYQQMDIPGITWGLVPVMVQEGIRYIMSWPNDGGRIGHTDDFNNQPFWWLGPDKKSKVLFFQPGPYANSGSMLKGADTGRPWFGKTNPDSIPSIIKLGNANVNFMNQITEVEESEYPYDFLVLSWSLWDNCPLDADVPAAVKAWNEEYAYPHINIAGGHEIMEMIETNYGDKIPTIEGDFTEYWTDGVGSAAKFTGINRNTKEKLVQAETLWTMLNKNKPVPRSDFDEAWRYTILADEHTWGAEDPSGPFFQDTIWNVKKSYFVEASNRSKQLLAKALTTVKDESASSSELSGKPESDLIAVFNTHSWKHGGLISLSNKESIMGDRVINNEGIDVPAQRLSTGELVFWASDIPAFGLRHYHIVPGKCPVTKGCTINGSTLNNQQLQVKIDSTTGNISQLINIPTNINYADIKINDGLNAFRWLSGDTINAFALADSSIKLSVVENGPLVVELRVDSKATGCRKVTRTIRLIHNQPWVEISNIVDKLPLVEKDGIHFGFGFDIPQSTTRVDIPWGIMSLEDDQWPIGNRNWMALQRWLDISNDKKGITWCSLDAPLFESGSMTANQIGFNGHKPWVRKIEPNSTVYSWAMNNHWFTNFPLTQDGPVTFRYRILPHNGYDPINANRFGMEQAQPLVHVQINNKYELKPPITIDNNRVSISILKSINKGNATIIRLRSLSNKDEKVMITFPARKTAGLYICNISEEPGEKISDEVVVPAMGITTLRAEWE